MSTERGNFKLVLIAIFLASLFYVPVSAELITGGVLDEDGNPIQGADVLVLDNGIVTVFTQTNEFGYFEVDTSENASSLVIYADDSTSLGIDYIPAQVPIQTESTITLLDAVSIFVKGRVQYVDTENLPVDTYYSILDENEQVVVPAGIPLVYDTRGNIFRKIPSFDGEQLIVPADSFVKVRINASTIVHSSDILDTTLVTDTIQTMSKGNVHQIVVSEYTYPLNNEQALVSITELSARIKEMAGYSFYLERQEVALSESLAFFDEADSLFALGEYSEAFDSLKRSYIISSHTLQEVSNMYNDAKLSTNILIGFLALASLILGYLLVEDLMKQLVADVFIFLGSGLVFYYIYPGSRIIPFSTFVGASVGYLVFFALCGYYIPKLIGTKGWDERVHTRNLLSPIFSIAKRSLRRRRMRFLLTLFSLTLLVMSFVTLTSFSESYGLILTEKQKHSDWNGVFILDSAWKEDVPSFIHLSDTEEQWLLDIPEVSALSVKAENIPQRRSFLNLESAPIKGVLGISEKEESIIGPTIILGTMPDDNGVMITETLAQSLEVSIGDTVHLFSLDLEVQGILDDTEFRRLKDLDGTEYVPNKWVNISPPGEPARYFLKPCETNEVVLLSVSNAITLPATGIQRLGLELHNVLDGLRVAERLALERGFQSTALLPDEQITVKLGNYFEGSGASLVIPWIIVVLNVVITMLNSLFERRGEIEVLSSIGLNPTQVSAIFLAEAVITGFIAGGFGYLMGLGVYELMTILNTGLQVNQKISAIWSVASIALAISAVLSGSFIALKNSIVITPSLMTRWKVGSQANISAPFEVAIPLKLLPDEVNPYIEYIMFRLRTHMDHPDKQTSGIRLSETEDGWVITFAYKSTSNMTGNFYTSNNLYVLPEVEGEHSVRLMSQGEPDWAHDIGTMIRLFSMDFSLNKDNREK